MRKRSDRREFLKGSATVLGALMLEQVPALAEEEPSVTCFYQFGKNSLEALAAALPNGPGYLHLFSHSHPGIRPHPDTARMVRAAGSSFKYALAFDLHKYPGWQSAPDEQLKTWAREFRAHALDAGGPADYFAFNEMPTTGAATPRLQEQAAKLVRFLHDPGEGPPLRGVFYFTERNLNPANWQGTGDDFWKALDETCDLVVGEHYHNYDFALGRTPEALAQHLFALPAWLRQSGKAPQQSITARKYAVIHSSYYGPAMTGWHGVNSAVHNAEALERYYRHLLAATRHSEFGKRRVSFGPLVAKEQDPQAYGVLARVLGADLKGS